MSSMIRCACCAHDMDLNIETVVVITVKVYHAGPEAAAKKFINVCPRCYAKRRPQLWGELWDIKL